MRTVRFGRFLLAVLTSYLAVAATYLAALVALSRFYRRREQAPTGVWVRLAVVIPARDEEDRIGRLLDSLEACDYPAACLEVHVVADNCTDSTALVSARPGVTVRERRGSPGKAHAIGWLVSQLDLSRFDGIVVVDADAIVSPEFLRVASECLAAGHEVIQGCNEILNESASTTNELTAWAFRLHNRIVPMGREVLGISAGLSGNGMVLSRRAFEKIDWASLGPAEDRELHARLVLRGLRVHFEPRARVMSDLPLQRDVVRAQHQRWDRGAILAAHRYAHPLIAAGLAARDPNRLLTGLSLISPNVSLQVVASLLCAVLGQSMGSSVSRNLAVGALALDAAAVSLAYAKGSRKPGLPLLAILPSYLALKARVLLPRFSRRL